MLQLNRLDDTKKAANDFMREQIHLWTLMGELNEKEYDEFMEWFSSQPHNKSITKFVRGIFV
ncbi:MAG: hypothetical protein WA667_19595 [Candidatus Nitrosopolaris sp.]